MKLIRIRRRGGVCFLDSKESSFTLYECRSLDKVVVIKAEYHDSIVAVDELESDAESWILKLRSGSYGVYPDKVSIEKDFKGLLALLNGGPDHV